MSPDIKEKAFENAIEAALLAGGPDAVGVGSKMIAELRPAEWGEFVPGGYRKRTPEEYDRERCLIPRDLLDFVITTQPKEWEKLKAHHGAEVKERFLSRVAGEIKSCGVRSRTPGASSDPPSSGLRAA